MRQLLKYTVASSFLGASLYAYISFCENRPWWQRLNRKLRGFGDSLDSLFQELEDAVGIEPVKHERLG